MKIAELTETRGLTPRLCKMKLLELFTADSPVKTEVRSSKASYIEDITVGGKKYRFSAHIYSLSSARQAELKTNVHSYWEISFSKRSDKYSTFRITGTGDEFKVFEFVVQATKRFVKEHKPDVVVFAADTSDPSRVKLYRHLVKRLGSGYKVVEKADTALVPGDVDFWLIKQSAVKEGMMKRSDPYISGELPGPRPVDKPLKSKYDRKILNLATKSHKSPEEVEQLWLDTKKTIDMSMPNAYAIVMAKVQRALGLREALNEEKFKHIENEDGELTYGWKTDLEDEEEPGYIPAGYSKKVLELGGIYATKPGQGQGDRLMKLFLDSPEAKKAELIFLDPVPGLGANFKSNISDTQQIRRLQAFYRRYGFRNRPGANRMWLVKKGTIPDDKLPS